MGIRAFPRVDLFPQEPTCETSIQKVIDFELLMILNDYLLVILFTTTLYCQLIKCHSSYL